MNAVQVEETGKQQQIKIRWWHFFVVGTLLYFLGGYLFHGEELAPPPTLNAEQSEIVRNNFLRSTGRYPDAAELNSLLAAEIDQTLLFEQAVAEKLHLNDPLIWRRMIRNMRFLGVEGSDSKLLNTAFEMGMHLSDPIVKRRVLQIMEIRARGQVGTAPDDYLQSEYQRRRDSEFRRERMAFLHLFFSSQRRPGDEVYSAVRQWIEANGCNRERFGREQGDHFPVGGHQVALKTEQQVAKQFGGHFARQLFAGWGRSGCLGPLESSFGQHYVYLLESSEEYIPFESASQQLAEEWATAEVRRVMDEEVQRLRTERGMTQP